MNIFKSIIVMVIILILQGLLKLRGKKTVPIKWHAQPAKRMRKEIGLKGDIIRWKGDV